LVRSAVEKLQVARANLIGAVLNQVDVTKDGYYGYYHRYYSRYYGENT
jgi:Mrp family chromosome partitioning ATPase